MTKKKVIKLIPPFAALAAIIFKDYLNIDIETQALETALGVVLTILVGVGIISNNE